MFVHHLDKDITVLYKDVPEFPMGIKGAFDELYGRFGGRSYYGLSHMEDGGRIVYKAAAEASEQEAAQYGYATMVIPEGDWLVVPISQWMEKTDSFKVVFGELMADPRFDRTYDCLEWYQSDTEMWCMVRCVAAL